jgi:hypothetical protein
LCATVGCRRESIKYKKLSIVLIIVNSAVFFMFNSKIEFKNCSFVVVISSSNQSSFIVDSTIAFSIVIIDSFFFIVSISSFFCLFKSSFQWSFCVVVIGVVYFEFNKSIIFFMHFSIRSIIFRLPNVYLALSSSRIILLMCFLYVVSVLIIIL